MPSRAKPSRLQPNQPLHMTTRRAASTIATNSSAVSVTSTDSRRSSVEDTTQVAGGFDIDVDRPTKRARLTDHSSATSDTKSAVRHSESTTPILDGSNQDANIPDIVATLEPSHLEARDGVSSPDVDDDDSLLDEREDDDGSDLQRLLSPVPRQRGRRFKVQRDLTPTGSVADSLLPDSPILEDLDDNDSDQNLPKAARRLPGRRRAPNADPYLEACLRRQLQLRMGHRAVSKALKAVLVELAIRTAETLEANDDDDFEDNAYLISELDRRLESRLEVLDNQCRITKGFHNERLEQDEQYLTMQHKDRIASAQVDFALWAEHRIFTLIRQYEHEFDDDVTDDEDGSVIHPLHGRPSFKAPTGRLDACYDSRSRFFLDFKRLEVLNNERNHIGKQQTAALHENNKSVIDHEGDIIPVTARQLPESFGDSDELRRHEAVAALNVHSLAYAAKAIEQEELERQKPRIPAISNAEAFGLQALAAAIEYGRDTSQTEHAQMHDKDLRYQQVPTEPLIKLEYPYPELPAHAYPAAPVPQENGFYPQTPGRSVTHGTEQERRRHHAISTPLRMPSGNAARPASSYSRATSESGDEASNKPSLYGPRSRRGYSTSAAISTGSPPLQAKREQYSEGSTKANLGSWSATSRDTQDFRYSQTTHQRGSPGHRSAGLLWQNTLSNGKARFEHDAPKLGQSESARRRRSEANIGAAYMGHTRKHSAPVTLDMNLHRAQSPPLARSPQTLQSPWRRQSSPLQLHSAAPSSALTSYHPTVPHYAVPYMAYVPPSAPNGAQEQSPRQQQQGVFFGPPPPPQFGHAAGPKEQAPWFRQ